MRISALREHGRSITPSPPDAVDEDHIRTAYYVMLGDSVTPDSRRTMFKRRLIQAIDRRTLLRALSMRKR